MADVLVKFTEPVRGSDGSVYDAQACGCAAEDGLWEAWIEFERDGEAIRTERETEQSNLDDLKYWAQGLSMVYLEGALARALDEPVAPVQESVPAPAAFGKPARREVQPIREIPQRPVLNPFLVYAEGPDILRQQLGALSRDQLSAIAVGYNLPLEVDPQQAPVREIAEDIVRLIRDGRRPQRVANTAAHQNL